jgi:hypothetical protein
MHLVTVDSSGTFFVFFVVISLAVHLVAFYYRGQTVIIVISSSH